jgi:adenosylcobinamide-phosphate synthase
MAPFYWFVAFELLFDMGIVVAPLFRAANTTDAMLDYRDDRIRIGWFAAGTNDLFTYLPAGVTGAVLLVLFACRGRFGRVLAVYLG